MKKHTIKLLTVAITLLTLTGCPGPVNTVVPCTHENKKTVIETAATCTETGLEKIICADCGELIEENTIEALGHDFGKWDVTEPIHSVTKCEDGKKVHTCSRCNKKEEEVIPVEHDFGDKWEITKNPTCTEKGSKTRKCSRCGETETVEIDALGHDWVLENENDNIHKCTNCETTADHTFIAGGCDECGAYKHNKEDDYQIKAYVYSSVKDAQNSENERVLYFSFPNNTTGIPQIVTIDGYLCINIDDLIQMKSGYAGKTVMYFNLTSLQYLLEDEYQGDPKLLTELKQSSSIYIVIE